MYQFVVLTDLFLGFLFILFNFLQFIQILIDSRLRHLKYYLMNLINNLLVYDNRPIFCTAFFLLLLVLVRLCGSLYILNQFHPLKSVLAVHPAEWDQCISRTKYLVTGTFCIALFCKTILPFLTHPGALKTFPGQFDLPESQLPKT